MCVFSCVCLCLCVSRCVRVCAHVYVCVCVLSFSIPGTVVRRHGCERDKALVFEQKNEKDLTSLGKTYFGCDAHEALNAGVL